MGSSPVRASFVSLTAGTNLQWELDSGGLGGSAGTERWKFFNIQLVDKQEENDFTVRCYT